jgi:hypothetical protein
MSGKQLSDFHELARISSVRAMLFSLNLIDEQIVSTKLLKLNVRQGLAQTD